MRIPGASTPLPRMEAEAAAGIPPHGTPPHLTTSSEEQVGTMHVLNTTNSEKQLCKIVCAKHDQLRGVCKTHVLNTTNSEKQLCKTHMSMTSSEGQVCKMCRQHQLCSDRWDMEPHLGSQIAPAADPSCVPSSPSSANLANASAGWGASHGLHEPAHGAAVMGEWACTAAGKCQAGWCRRNVGA